MPHYDLPLAELEQYAPPRHEPTDFSDFWATTLAETRAHDLAVRAEPAAAYLQHVEVHDVTFAGFGGHPIRAWHLRPRAVEGPLPTVVQFLGYGDGRGTPVDWLMFRCALVPIALVR